MNKEIPCTRCFGTLGVPSRMEIFNFLREKGPCSVNTIVNISSLTQPTVSYHLKEMKNSGILTRIKKGKEVFYEISDKCPYSNSGCLLNKIKFPTK